METKIVEMFVERLGDPVEICLLYEYVVFCLINRVEVKIDGVMYESHHILPRSVFPELLNATDYFSVLKYADHVSAHFLLMRAYPIRKFINPCNFMTITEDHKIELSAARSAATIQSWVDLKNDASAYAKRVELCRENHARLFYEGSPALDKVRLGVQRFYANHPNRPAEISEFFKNWWSEMSDEEYIRICESRRWKDADNYEERCALVADRYKDPLFYSNFVETMTVVNSNEDKRADAGEKIAKLWQTEEFSTAVMNGRAKGNAERRKRGEKRGNSKSIKARWEDPEFKAKQRESRIKAGKIRPLEYNGVTYYGWDELKLHTGLTQHFYKLYIKEKEINETKID